jgi:protein-tyrosine phosphatase
MIDLHCHMLPGIDDGSPDLATSLAMAKIAVADGIQVTACTPHIYPGLYENDSIGIASAVEKFRQALERDSVGLRLTYGADIQIVPELLAGLRCGTHPHAQ